MSIYAAGGYYLSFRGEGALFTAGDPVFGPELPSLPDAKTVLPQFPSRFGRFDTYTKQGLLCGSLALREAGIEADGILNNIGICLESRLECTETDIRFYETTKEEDGAFTSPNLFSYTLPGIVCGETAILYSLTGPVFTVSGGGNDPGVSAVQAASLILETGQADGVLCGWNDAADPSGQLFPCPVNGAAFVYLTRNPGPDKPVFRLPEDTPVSLPDIFREAR
jgi:hypothetical protein